MNKNTGIIIAVVVAVAVISFSNIAHGQTEAQRQQKESLLALLDYCFQHADRPNPLQDLIDKGLLSVTFTGETCKSVKQMYDLLEIKIGEYNKNQKAEFEKNERKFDAFAECMRNQNTYPECKLIQDRTK